MPTAGCCRLSIASTAKCILVCSPSLLKWACVTVNCCARLCAGQGLDPSAVLEQHTALGIWSCTWRQLLNLSFMNLNLREALSSYVQHGSEHLSHTSILQEGRHSDALRTKSNRRALDGEIILVLRAEKAETEHPTLCMKLPSSASRGLYFSLPPCSLTVPSPSLNLYVSPSMQLR